MAVLYERGEHGYLAAPVARDVIKAYFDKKRSSQSHYAQKPESNKDMPAGRSVPEQEG